MSFSATSSMGIVTNNAQYQFSFSVKAVFKITALSNTTNKTMMPLIEIFL
jgi:hypothetical protein